MKMRALKSVDTAAPATELSTLERIAAEIAKLNEAVGKLRADDRELLNEDIALQKTIAPSRDDKLHQAALALLDGPGAAGSASTSGGARLQEIKVQRAEIAKALEIANGRMMRLLFDRAIEKRKLIADDWAELQRERCLAVAHLQRLNRQAQQMLSTVIDPYGRAEMPAAFAGLSPAKFLLGNGSLRAGEAHDFVELCIANGTVTRGEIDRIKEGS